MGYITQNRINITTIDKYHLKCDCIDGSKLNGISEPKLCCFTLDNFPVLKYFLSQRQYIKKN